MNRKDRPKKATRQGAGKKRAKAEQTPKPRFIIEQERAYKKFHEEIDKAMERAYKPHGPLKILDLKQAIKNVTRVVRKFCSVSKQRGKQRSALVQKALQIKSENKGRTYRQILKAEHPDWDKSKLDEEVIKLRASSRQARKRDKARFMKKGE